MRTRLLLFAPLVIAASVHAQQPDTGTLLGPGNAMSFDFHTADMVNPPPTWGERCGAFVIGPDSGAAYWYQQYPVPSTRGYITDLDFMLAGTAMADGTSITIAISKAHGDILTAQRNWRLYFHRVGLSYEFMFVIDEDDEQAVWRYGPIVVGQVYHPRMTYDIVHHQIAFAVDGVLVNRVAMIPGNPQDVATTIVGSSKSSDGRDTIFLVDNVMWREVP
jgi:hypothetical protein